MRSQIAILFFFLVFGLSAQEPGDPDYVYTSIDEAMKLKEYVYHLDLSKQKRNEFPLEVCSFPELLSLNLSKNKISLVPKEIGQLKSLRILDLSKNSISSIPPQMGRLESLEELNLSKNKIEKIPAEIGNLNQLRSLNLWQNEIQEIHPDIQKMRALNLLDLRGMIIPTELEFKLQEWFPDINLMLSNACNCKN